MKPNTTRIMALAITLAIVFAVIFIGPAKAFILGFTISDSNIQKGDSTTVFFTVDIQSGDSLNIKNLSLVFTGPLNKECTFTPEGIPISGCSGISITSFTDNVSFGYGYGYSLGSSQLKYNITIDSSSFLTGNYTVLLLLHLPASTISSIGKTLIITDGFPKINSPVENAIYNDRQVPLDVEFGTNIGSFLFSDKGSPFRTLCRDCSVYNQTKPFDDGFHNVIIKIIDFGGAELTRSINFTVDSKAPRVIDLQAKPLTSGNFSLTFQEENPKSLIFFYGNSNNTLSKIIDISSCTRIGLNTKCQFTLDLSIFDNKSINFWFNITDIAGKSTISDKKKTLVDTSKPVINSFNITESGSPSSKSVIIKINITDNNFESVLLTKIKDNNVTTTLCSNLQSGICQRTKIFSAGDIISLAVLDKAGNKAVIGPITI